MPRLGIEVPPGTGLESSSEKEYGEPFSEEANKSGAVDYGFDGGFAGDGEYVLYSRRDV